MDRSVDFSKLVDLSRLSLSREEEESLRKDFFQIADFAATVAAMSCSQSDAEEGICPLREDLSRASLPRDELLALTVQARDGFFSVPHVMEGSDHD